MNTAIVEVGPQTVRGVESAPREWISAAIECIDDELALRDFRPVAVRRLWSDLLEVVVGDRADTLVLIFPTCWSSSRVDLVTDSAEAIAAEVVVLQRASALAVGGSTVVELCEEFVVIAAPDAEVRVLPRRTHDSAEHFVAEYLGVATEVLIDVPAEVSPLPRAVVIWLRVEGIPVTHGGRHCLAQAAGLALSDEVPRELDVSRARLGGVAAALVGVIGVLSAVAGSFVAQRGEVQPPADRSTMLLTEGRVEVRVPAQWAVERITSGPGSARLRVSAPTGDSTAIHLTQSAVPASTTISEVAETLQLALESEPPGVFAELDHAGSIGGRPAVTYRELRAGSETNWAVVVDGAIRVAIGCQNPPGRSEDIREACVQAVQSAHVLR